MAGNIYEFMDPEYGPYWMDDEMIDEIYESGEEPPWEDLVEDDEE